MQLSRRCWLVMWMPASAAGMRTDCELCVSASMTRKDRLGGSPCNITT
jgi:hypothetical protein